MPRVAKEAPAAAGSARWLLGDLRTVPRGGRHSDEAPSVSVVIPGAKNRGQALANAAAGELPALSSATMRTLREIYEDRIAKHVHHRW